MCISSAIQSHNFKLGYIAEKEKNLITYEIYKQNKKSRFQLLRLSGVEKTNQVSGGQYFRFYFEEVEITLSVSV